MAVQESLPIFKALAELSKFMEGEKYILSSSYWVALSTIEAVLAPNPADSPLVAALRAGMSRDHFGKRVTLEQSVQNPLHVMMHLLDPRCVVIDRCLSLHLSMLLFFLLYCSWRHNRAGVLSDAHYTAAKAIALNYIPKFFPGDVSKPVFVPLHANVATKVNELKEELKDPDAAFPIPAPAPASAAPPHHAAPFALAFHLDLDRGIEVKSERKDEPHNLQWQMDYWFSPASPFLRWNDESSQPCVNWKRDEVTLPRLAFLARRFFVFF